MKGGEGYNCNPCFLCIIGGEWDDGDVIGWLEYWMEDIQKINTLVSLPLPPPLPQSSSNLLPPPLQSYHSLLPSKSFPNHHHHPLPALALLKGGGEGKKPNKHIRVSFCGPLHRLFTKMRIENRCFLLQFRVSFH